MKEKAVTFDDVLIRPKFSDAGSRKGVDLSTNLHKINLTLPVISANMSTITDADMAIAMAKSGGLGILHRFNSIEDNVAEYAKASKFGPVGVSIGISEAEQLRGEALIEAGASIFCIDVAHGAQESVLNQYHWLRQKVGSQATVIVGNFATPDTIREFRRRCTINPPDFYKVGIGPGSVCSTRIKTGVGIPQFAAVMSCAKDYPDQIIADGGMKTPGDIAKALGAGAVAVMLGGMIAGTDETPGDVIQNGGVVSTLDNGTPIMSMRNPDLPDRYKTYKGSAANGYGNGWKTSEGVETKVAYKGAVEPILKDIEGGLRSSLTYTGSKNLNEFRKNCTFVLVSNSTRVENSPHGKKG